MVAFAVEVEHGDSYGRRSKVWMAAMVVEAVGGGWCTNPECPGVCLLLLVLVPSC